MRTRILFVLLTALIATLATAAGNPGNGSGGFTDDFALEYGADFVPTGGNLYFSLNPGTFLRYEGEDDGELVELEITVLPQVKTIRFKVDGRWKTARTRIIEEREWENGELIEVSRNYFARRKGTEDIYYFGEDVDIYDDGEVVSHDGAWLAGRQHAEPGVIMPGLFLLGSKYFQEIAPGVALDQAEHVEMDLDVETPAGVFEDCVKVLETTPLEPGSESVKIYAPGLGLIVDNDVELVEFRKNGGSLSLLSMLRKKTSGALNLDDVCGETPGKGLFISP